MERVIKANRRYSAKGTHIFVFWYETRASFRFEHEDLYDLPCLLIERMRSWQSHCKADGKLLVGRSLTRKFWGLRKGRLLENEIFKDELVPVFLSPIYFQFIFVYCMQHRYRYGRNNFFSETSYGSSLWKGRKRANLSSQYKWNWKIHSLQSTLALSVTHQSLGMRTRCPAKNLLSSTTNPCMYHSNIRLL